MGGLGLAMFVAFKFGYGAMGPACVMAVLPILAGMACIYASVRKNRGTDECPDEAPEYDPNSINVPGYDANCNSASYVAPGPTQMGSMGSGPGQPQVGAVGHGISGVAPQQGLPTGVLVLGGGLLILVPLLCCCGFFLFGKTSSRRRTDSLNDAERMV